MSRSAVAVGSGLGLVLGFAVRGFFVQPEPGRVITAVPDSPLTRDAATDAIPVRGASAVPATTAPPDAGAPCVCPELTATESAVGLLEQSHALVEHVASAHDFAREPCVRAYGGDDPNPEPNPHDVCGSLSETMWLATHGSVNEALGSLMRFAGPDGVPSLLDDVNCDALDDEEFGAALHIAAVARAYTSPRFLQCAVRRESAHEDYALWSLLTIFQGIPGAQRWVPEGPYHDDRTIVRLQALGL